MLVLCHIICDLIGLPLCNVGEEVSLKDPLPQRGTELNATFSLDVRKVLFDTCWGGSYTEDLCCDDDDGARGDEACWSSSFTYERCCASRAIAKCSLADSVTSGVLVVCLCLTWGAAAFGLARLNRSSTSDF